MRRSLENLGDRKQAAEATGGSELGLENRKEVASSRVFMVQGSAVTPPAAPANNRFQRGPAQRRKGVQSYGS